MAIFTSKKRLPGDFPVEAPEIRADVPLAQRLEVDAVQAGTGVLCNWWILDILYIYIFLHTIWLTSISSKKVLTTITLVDKS